MISLELVGNILATTGAAGTIVLFGLAYLQIKNLYKQFQILHRPPIDTGTFRRMAYAIKDKYLAWSIVGLSISYIGLVIIGIADGNFLYALLSVGVAFACTQWLNMGPMLPRSSSVI